MIERVDAQLDEAEEIVAAFVYRHHAAAIPCLVTACVKWAIENGAADLMRASLQRTIDMSFDAEAAFKRGQQ